MNKKLLKKIMYVLIHSYGDTRLCPHCNKIFVPQDRTSKECYELYNELKEIHEV